MQVKISPNFSANPKPISMIKTLYTMCSFSMIDAKHYVEYASTHGSVIIYLPGMRKTDWPTIQAYADSCGYVAELVSSK